MKYIIQPEYAIMLILMSMILCACSKTSPNVALLEELDSTIEKRDLYHEQKERKIDSVKQEITVAITPEDRFHAMGHLLDEYKSYNTDSAIILCEKRIALADSSGNPELKIHAKLSVADVLSLMGLYKEATDIMQSCSRDSIPEYLLAYYYHINRTIYGFMSDYTVIKEEKDKYKELTDAYRDSIMMKNEPGSLYYVLSKSDQMNVNGNPSEVAKLLEEYLSDNKLTDHEKAISAYTLSESYRLLGEKDQEKKQLIISSINDMKSGVNEYISLRKLALMLYDNGDVSRAYEYLKICMEDAQECNARLRIIEINDIFPVVNNVYLDTINAQQKRLRWGFVLVCFLAFLLMAMILFLYKEKKKVEVARQSTNEANDRLLLLNNELKNTNQNLAQANARESLLNKELRDANQNLAQANERQTALNSELKAANQSLIQANNSIKENSCLKEEFIAQYMGQCAMYIEKIDLYQKTISRIDMTKQYSDLKKVLRTLPTSDNEARAFYDNFDDTFLKLFPSFVKDFNGLLKPGEEIIPKVSGKLNTELRIFALIRLGINDSVRIAQFLRYTPTTIYNYRTRVRNKAKGNRDTLEGELMKLGNFE